MSMKFFRQTKETKRKLSFFMALAMVISLLPVSPVAKASDGKAKFTVYSTVSGAAVSDISNPLTGTAVITLKGNNNKLITGVGTLEAEVVNNTNIANAVSTYSSINVTSGSVAITGGCIEKPELNNGIVTIKVSNITKDDAVLLKGEVVLESNSTETPAPGTPTPGTPAPVVKHTVTVTNNVGANISLSVNGNEIPEAGKELSIEDGKTIPVEITAAADYVWDKPSEVKVNNALVPENELTLSGAKYATEVVINKDTIIAVSGGSVLSVSGVTNKIEEAKPADGNTPGATIDISNVKNSIVQAIIDANPGMTTGAIITALENEKSSITTEYKIAETTSSGAVTTIKNSFNSLQETLGSNITVENFNKAIEEGYTVDIDILVTYTLNGSSKTTTISVLGDKVLVTIPVPAALKDKDTTKGGYYAFRIHDNEVTALPCTPTDNGNLTFESDKFSTYVISFVEKENTSTATPAPTPTGGNNSGSTGGIGGYVPSNSATPAPSATAAPSASPSADPSATPGADSSAAPTESGAPTTGGDTTPTKAPAATDKPVDTDKDNTNGGSTAVKVGKKATVSGSQYKVTAVKGTRTVQFTKGKKNAKSIVVPSTVKISGKNYKVTTIAKNAFKGNKKLAKVTIGKNVNKIGVSAFQNCSKLKSIIIKSTKLTAKKVGKNAFKGINKKATFKVPKSKVKAYKKIVKAKGAGKNVKVKK